VGRGSISDPSPVGWSYNERCDNMNVETKLGPKTTLVIPAKYYRQLSSLKYDRILGRDRWGRPIRPGSVVHCYRNTMEQLAWWLWDATKEFGYRTASFKISQVSYNEFELQQTDNPFDSFWVGNILGPISHQFDFSDDWNLWSKDP